MKIIRYLVSSKVNLLLLLLINRSEVFGWFSSSSSTYTQKSKRGLPSVATVTSVPVTAEERAAIAKATWQTIGLVETPHSKEDEILFNDNTRVTVYNDRLFKEFAKMKGSYFINGLSSWKVGGQPIHPVESHGYVKSLTFDGSGKSLKMKSSTVNTPLTSWERRLQVPLARGFMSSLGSPILNALSSSERNTANLCATHWPPTEKSSKSAIIIVGSDNGMPYVVDPKTMKTVSPLSSFLPDLIGKKLLAHTRIDEQRQRLILCSCSYQLQGPKCPESNLIEFYEYDVNFELVSKQSYQTDRFIVFHDWMITENYYVVPKNPATFKWDMLPQFITGLTKGTEVFEMDDNSVGEFILIPRHNLTADVYEYPTDSFFNIFHLGPCYEEIDRVNSRSLLTIYANVFDQVEFFGTMGYNGSKRPLDPIRWSSSKNVPPPNLDKFVLDLSSSSMIKRERISVVDRQNKEVDGKMIKIPVDMPTFLKDGAPCRYCYFCGAARPEGWFPFRSIVKADLQMKRTWNWDAGDERIVSEPMFLPRQNSKKEDDGFVISIVHNAKEMKSELVVWDSPTFGNGPIGIINLGDLMPWCVHGCWVPDFVPQGI